MIETSLIGFALGGVFRLIPEIMKMLDRKNEREHELKMTDKQLEYVKVAGQMKIEEIQTSGQIEYDKMALDTLKEAIKTQSFEFKPTGIKWVDVLLAAVVAVNSTVRPVITYWLFFAYMLAKLAIYVSAVQAGNTWHEAVKMAWTEADQGLLSGVLNFWFLGRIFDKKK